jgi:hypothetical protein
MKGAALPAPLAPLKQRGSIAGLRAGIEGFNVLSTSCNMNKSIKKSPKRKILIDHFVHLLKFRYIQLYNLQLILKYLFINDLGMELYINLSS